MHIVQVLFQQMPPANYGGVERIATWLTEDLLNKGHKVSLITKAPTTYFNHFKNFNLIPMKQELEDYREYIPKDADIIHVHSELSKEYTSQVAPTIATCHTLRKNFSEHFQNTVFVSQKHAEIHGGTHFVYNGVKVDEIPFTKDKENYMSFMALTKARPKNLSTAINIAFDLNLNLHIGGGNTFDRKGSWLLRYPFKKNLLHFHGTLAGEEKFNLLKNSKLFFYLTYYEEPFGIAIHEALATGTPILAAPNGALPEFINHGTNGFIVNSYQEAKDSVERVMSMSNKEFATMAQACRDSAFTTQSMTENYLNYYLKLINGDGRLYPEKEQPRFIYNKKSRVIIKKPMSFDFL